MNESILIETIQKAEEIRYLCIGSTATEYLMYVKSNNEVMIIHANRIIFHTFIPDYYEVHPNIAYLRSSIQYDKDKKPILENGLDHLDLFNFQRLDYCEQKFQQYIGIRSHLNIIAQEESLKDHPSFEEISKIRSKDGLKYFKVNMLHDRNSVINIPYFVGLYGIKRADKYGITVYDFDNYHFLVNMTDKKPRLNNPIDIIMCILKGV